jgi:serine/threonine-protein kinase
LLPTGASVGPYTIGALLGVGGMGEVYLARDPRLHRDVAIKVLPAAFASDPHRRRRFEHEARAVASLNHPNIVAVHDVGLDGGLPYIVMERVRGETLQALVRRESFLLTRALHVARGIASALAEAHAHDVVHRDLKPANVMVTPEGLVKVVDFGIAKTALVEPTEPMEDRDRDVERTHPGQLIGTPGYMSPEQLFGRSVDYRTDIYSLGVILFELVAGQRPSQGQGLAALRLAALRMPPPRASDLNPAVPAALSDLIAMALSREPAARPSAELFRAELDALLAGPGPARAKLPSIAVLPFSDMSPAKDHEFFCDGMADELISALTRIAGLRVAARTSAFQFKGKSRDVRFIGEALGVAAVLDGSVRKNGERLRVTVELIGTADGFVLWSERFDCELKDIFTVQDEITRSIVVALRGRLADDGRSIDAPRRTNVETYRLYLEGRYHWNKRTEEELTKSVACFERALEHDPGHAPSYAALADAYVTLATYGARPALEVMPRASSALQQALRLAPALSQAYTCRGCVRALFEWDWAGAEADFQTALGLNAAYPTAHHWYAIHHLVPLGRFREASASLHRALDLDPLALAIKTSLGLTCYFSGHFADAVDEFLKTIELDERFGIARLFLGATYTEQSRYAEAHSELEAAIRLSGPTPEILAAVGYLHGRSGDETAARVVLDDLRRLARDRYVSPARLAQVHLGLDEHNEALSLLERAHAERAPDLAWIAVRPVFGSVRTTSRFIALLERMGLAGMTMGHGGEPRVTDDDTTAGAQ